MVSMVVYLLLLLLLVLSTTTLAASADSTRHKTLPITLPGCPASCGNISIPYPFGIKPGCFRSLGYQLTCTNRKLFIGDHNSTVEVMEIDYHQAVFVINTPIFIIPADRDSYNTYWTPLKGGPYVLRYNTFNVVGCGIAAYLVDSETGELGSSCMSVCGSNYSLRDGMDCIGSGCCSAYYQNARSYEIRFNRLFGEGEGKGRVSGKAFLTSGNYVFSKDDLISSNLINGSSVVPRALEWTIRDQSSCKEAKRNMSTYACRSNYSYCVDYSDYPSQFYTAGYTCKCSSWDENSDSYNPDGNPYVSGGCPGS